MAVTEPALITWGISALRRSTDIAPLDRSIHSIVTEVALSDPELIHQRRSTPPASRPTAMVEFVNSRSGRTGVRPRLWVASTARTA